MRETLPFKFREAWRRHRATALVVTVLVLCLIQALGPEAARALRYERTSIGAGEGWRILSGQLVHLNAMHLAMNLAALVLLWFLYVEDARPRDWCFIALGSALGVGLGLYFFEPGIAWYVGISGALHGIWAGGGIACRRRWRLESGVTLALLAGKLLLEAWHGPVSGLLGASLPVVSAAHRLGALAGALVALGLGLGRRRL